MTAWRTNATNHALMRGSFFVKRALMKVPNKMKRAGRIHFQCPETPCVNSQVGATVIEGNAKIVTSRPRFDGFRKWRRRPPRVMVKIDFDVIAITAANAPGSNRSGEYNNIAIANAV